MAHTNFLTNAPLVAAIDTVVETDPGMRLDELAGVLEEVKLTPLPSGLVEARLHSTKHVNHDEVLGYAPDLDTAAYAACVASGSVYAYSFTPGDLHGDSADEHGVTIVLRTYCAGDDHHVTAYSHRAHPCLTESTAEDDVEAAIRLELHVRRMVFAAVVDKAGERRAR